MQIYKAAQQVLETAGHPMHPSDILMEIERRGLFQFGAKDPKAVLTQTLRKRSVPPGDTGPAIFIKYPNRTYGLAKWADAPPSQAPDVRRI